MFACFEQYQYIVDITFFIKTSQAHHFVGVMMSYESLTDTQKKLI